MTLGQTSLGWRPSFAGAAGSMWPHHKPQVPHQRVPQHTKSDLGMCSTDPGYGYRALSTILIELGACKAISCQAILRVLQNFSTQAGVGWGDAIMEELWCDLPGRRWFFPSSCSLPWMPGAHPGHCAALLGGQAARDPPSLAHERLAPADS